MNENVKCHCMPAEALSALLLRAGLGVLFLFFGLNKFLGEGGVLAAIDGLSAPFRDTYLPMFLVHPFAHAIPFAEVVLGPLLIVGLVTRAALLGSGVFMIVLTAGAAVLGRPDTVANNMLYVLMIVAALWFAAQDNRYSLDKLFRIH